MIALYYTVEVITLLASVALASVLIGRDPGQRINRLMAMVPALLAAWCLGELTWNLSPDASTASFWIRLTAASWMLLGPACLHVFSELAGRHHPWTRRFVVPSYLVCGVVSLVHLVTGLGLAGVVPTPWGYAFRLAPSFALLYLTMALPLGYVLLTSRQILPGWGTSRQRRLWSLLYVAVVLSLVLATSTDIVLPALGVACPPFGTTSILLVTLGVAFQFNRYGYSLMAPSAFAREILEALGDGVVMLRANGDVRIANETFERLVGETTAEMRGVPFSRYVPSLDVDLQTLSDDIECELATRGGGSIPVLITPTPLQNPSGNTRGAALVVRDLREVSALRGSLVASDRLAMVGGLSASIVEEIREPVHATRSHLEGVRARLSLLRETAARCNEREKLEELVVDREELVEECLEGIARIEGIVRDVRGFATSPTAPRVDADLVELIEEAVRIATARASAEIEIERRFEPLRPVSCVPGEIVQVLVNLLVNAIHATQGRGRVQLSSWQHDNEVWIGIEDDGCGIPRDVINRIFDPFFTTKPVGEGTGLGLAISHHIVRNHGGDLRVESEPGRGSRFTLALPLDPARPCGRAAVSASATR